MIRFEFDGKVQALMGKNPQTTGWSNGDFGKTWTPESKPSNPRRDEQVELILRLAETVRPETILDLGCGPGAIAELLLRRFSELNYHGVDSSQDSIARAQKNLASFESRTTLEKNDFEHLEIRDGKTFDLILACQSMHHLNAQGKRNLICRIHSLLSPTGMFILCDRFEMVHRSSLDCILSVENLARAQNRFQPFDDQYSYSDYLQRHKDNFDQPDSIEFHLAALRNLGFEADCVWQFGFRAIIVARTEEKSGHHSFRFALEN